MGRTELVEKINKFLDENPFTDEDVLFWRGKLNKMDDNQLSELFNLLQEKVKIISNTNQLFLNMADELNKKEEQSEGSIPKKIDISDMAFEDLLAIFKENLVSWLLKDKEVNLIYQLDNYFFISKIIEEEIVDKFDQLINAVTSNKEILFRGDVNVKNISIGGWLSRYRNFNNNLVKKTIDRINFLNGDNLAKELNQEQKNILISLLKIYDFFIDPANVINEISDNNYIKSKVRKIDGPPKTQEEKKIDELKEMLPEEEGVGKMAIEEGISDTQKIDELKIMANRYKDNSLQKRAIEEEIKKLEAK